MLFIEALTEQSRDDRKYMLELYDRFGQVMLLTAKRYCCDKTAAEDVVQDSLIKLISKISTLRGLESCVLSSYIIYTVRNTAFNYNAHQKVVEKYISKQELDENTIDDTALNPEVLMLSEEQKAEFKVLFKQLPEADQELLKGKYMFRLDDEELANMLGCKPSSVRMKLTRAKRNALKLKKEGEFACD